VIVDDSVQLCSGTGLRGILNSSFLCVLVRSSWF